MTNSEMAQELREAMMVYTAVHGKEKGGISTKSHITDKKWAKEYLQSIGIGKVHNTVDVKESKKKRDIENRRIGHFCL